VSINLKPQQQQQLQLQQQYPPPATTPLFVQSPPVFIGNPFPHSPYPYPQWEKQMMPPLRRAGSFNAKIMSAVSKSS